jgi:protein-S-isoprenylcysteine O-methyltransferase Ste14
MRDWIFKYRGLLFVPLALAVLILGKPTPASFCSGLILALAGELLRCWGVGYSGVTTRENKITAPFLVTAGPYAYVRNPLYLGNFITGLGFCLMACGALNWGYRIIFIGLAVVSYYVIYNEIIKLEENYLLQTFGAPYQEYLQAVPRLFPYKKVYAQRQGNFSLEVIWKAEIHTLMLLVIVIAVFIWKTF